jgi:cytochrome P450
VSTLLSAKLGGTRDLRTDELVSTVIHLLFAGQETNARVLGSLMWLVLSERERWLDLVAHPELALEAFEEALRMEPPVTFHARRTIEPVEIGGVAIPAGATVHLVFASANHDDAAFANPEEFDPRRENVTRHLGFGRGIHFCVGAPIARLESRIAVERLVERLPTLRLRPGETARHEPHVMLRGLESLYLEWDP